MGIKGEQVQAKGICNIFKKIITKFLKSWESDTHSGTGYQIDMTKIEPLYGILSLKQLAKRARKKY
jgi:hypothetical protein